MTGSNVETGVLRILLVEDNDAHAELIMRYFEDSHIPNDIHRLSDGEEALDYLFRRGDYAALDVCERPQVILLDLSLPGIDGFDILKAIKSSPEFKTIPVIVLSSSSLDADIARAYEYHANSYLVKPVDHRQFMKLTGEVGVYWMSWNRSLRAEHVEC